MALHPAAQYAANLLAIHRGTGLAQRRKRVGAQQWPGAIEQEYGTKIVQLVHRARAAFTPLEKELPRMLARIQQSRGDADMPTIELERGPLSDVEFAGFPIMIENPAGSVRCWGEGEHAGQTVMKYDYGYIAGALGVDGDEVDVYLGPDENAEWVYVVHQMKPPSFTVYDEDKCLIGFQSADAARAAYLSQYNDPRFFGGMSQMSVEQFRRALVKHEGSKIIHVDASPGLYRADVGELDYAKTLIDRAKAQMDHDLTDSEIESLARFFAERTNKDQRAALAKQLTQALGIEVLPDDRHIPQLMDYFVHENATLISSIPSKLHDDVASLTARAFSKRMNPETFAQLLQQRFDIAENRARFIARDQLGTLNGQLNQARQAGLGVTHFFWKTRKDPKVRPDHRVREGRRFEWDNPPGDEIPGVPINCRCTATPDVSDILSAASENRTKSFRRT